MSIKNCVSHSSFRSRHIQKGIAEFKKKSFTDLLHSLREPPSHILLCIKLKGTRHIIDNIEAELKQKFKNYVIT